MTLPLFPALPGLSWPVTRTNLGFEVDRTESVSGRRTAFPSRTTPRYRWSLVFEFLRTGRINAATYVELETLEGFYNGRFGTTYAFAYVEPADSIAASQSFGSGDGATVRFQLVRTRGGFTEPVRAPQQVAILVNGVIQDPVTYSVSNFGRVTFATAPAQGAALTWTGTYGWLCRFDDDTVDFQAIMQGYWTAPKLTFSSEAL